MPTEPSADVPSEILWLPAVNAAFDAMLREIDRAKESVRLEMYIFTQSPVGERFREALVRAAARGVKVQVLIDAVGSISLPASFWEPLLKAGGSFRWFNPLHLWRLSIRNHRKLLVCDERVAFAGGFNIAREYDGDGVTHGWFDLGLRIRGPHARELAASFDRLFDGAAFQRRSLLRRSHTKWPRPAAASGIRVMMTGPGQGRRPLRQALLRDIQRTVSTRIISAYFLPTRAIRRALFQSARSGRQTQLILAGKSDVPLARLASRHLYQGFLKAGVEIYEYQPQVLHAKLIVLDHTVYAGSANLDRRSFFINYELLLRIESAEAAAEAAGIFDRALQHCRRIDPRHWRHARSFWSKLQERIAFLLLSRLDPYIAARQVRQIGR